MPRLQVAGTAERRSVGEVKEDMKFILKGVV